LLHVPFEVTTLPPLSLNEPVEVYFELETFVTVVSPLLTTLPEETDVVLTGCHTIVLPFHPLEVDMP
jgi:hypothetical protein